MEKKEYLTLDNEFLQYCKINKIQDIQKLAKNLFNKGFTILKYGETPLPIKSDKTLDGELKEIIANKDNEINKLKKECEELNKQLGELKINKQPKREASLDIYDE